MVRSYKRNFIEVLWILQILVVDTVIKIKINFILVIIEVVEQDIVSVLVEENEGKNLLVFPVYIFILDFIPISSGDYKLVSIIFFIHYSELHQRVDHEPFYGDRVYVNNWCLLETIYAVKLMNVGLINVFSDISF